MKTVNKKLIAPKVIFAVSILITPFLINAYFKAPPFEKHRYQIETTSELFVHGSSNVNNFTCDCSCERDFTRSTLEIIRRPDGDCVDFKNAALNLTTTNLNCGHPQMNKDLYKTLKAFEYPHISIELLHAQILSDANIFSAAQWNQFDVVTNITLADQTNQVDIAVQGRQISNNRYQFSGKVNLNMTAFGLNPPRAMLGLIKVKDSITIEINLVVSLLDS